MALAGTIFVAIRTGKSADKTAASAEWTSILNARKDLHADLEENRAKLETAYRALEQEVKNLRYKIDQLRDDHERNRERIIDLETQNNQLKSVNARLISHINAGKGPPPPL